MPQLKAMMSSIKKSIHELFTKNDIRYESVVSKTEHLSKGNKLGIVDSAVRTIKKMINKYMDLTDDPKWYNHMDKILNIYNNTPHSSLKNKTPLEVYDDLKFQAKLYKEGRASNDKLNKSIDLDIGDFVRKSLDKSKFEKEKAKYSKEIYVIHDVIGYKYLLMDKNGDVDERPYKYSQLLKLDPTKTKTFSMLEALTKKQKPSKKRKDVEDVVDESEVDKARRIYKKAKRTMRKLKKEGIEADTVVLQDTKRKRKEPEESIADRLIKRRVLRVI